MFAFKLAKEGSELYLGGTNPDLYKEPIEWYSLLSRSYWVRF
jgi:cathepsin D